VAFLTVTFLVLAAGSATLRAAVGIRRQLDARQ
jgi:hypothetical protein